MFENYSAVDVLENHCWAHRRFFKSIHFLEQVWFKCESHHRFFPVVTSLIHEESHMSPTKSLFDVGSRRISIFIVNIFISLGCSGNTTRIMRRTLYVYFLTFHIVWNSKYIDKCVLMRFVWWSLASRLNSAFLVVGDWSGVSCFNINIARIERSIVMQGPPWEWNKYLLRDIWVARRFSAVRHWVHKVFILQYWCHFCDIQ